MNCATDGQAGGQCARIVGRTGRRADMCARQAATSSRAQQTIFTPPILSASAPTPTRHMIAHRGFGNVRSFPLAANTSGPSPLLEAVRHPRACLRSPQGAETSFTALRSRSGPSKCKVQHLAALRSSNATALPATCAEDCSEFVQRSCRVLPLCGFCQFKRFR